MFAVLIAQGCTQNPPASGPLASADTTDATNDFYDNAPTRRLDPAGEITIEGEVAEAGKFAFHHLPLRSLVVKETRLEEGEEKFVGAYRYQGYSLYDILNEVKIDKANKEKYAPIIIF